MRHDSIALDGYLLVRRECCHVLGEHERAVHIHVRDWDETEVDLLAGLAEAERLAVQTECGLLNEVVVG